MKQSSLDFVFSYVEGDGYFVPTGDETEKRLSEFKPFFENSTIAKIGHNMKANIQILKRFGVELRGELFDAMVAHYLIDPEMRHDLEIIAENYLGYTPIKRDELLGKKATLQEAELVDLRDMGSETCRYLPSGA